MDEVIITAVILAGGQGRRLDRKGKYSVILGKNFLIEHVVNRLKKQTKNVIINTKYKDSIIKKLGLLCIEDSFNNQEDGYGPLAGIHAALNYSQKEFGNSSLVLSVPVDTPFLPANLISRLLSSFVVNNNDISIAMSKGRIHPTIALWKSSLKSDLEKCLNSGIRKIDSFTKQFDLSYVKWDDTNDPFFNINNRHDLTLATERIKNN